MGRAWYDALRWPPQASSPNRRYGTACFHLLLRLLLLRSRRLRFLKKNGLSTASPRTERLVDLEELDYHQLCPILTHRPLTLELEGRVGGDDGREASGAVRVVGRADQVGLLAERELRDTLVPALDDLSDANAGRERRSAVSRRVELGSVLEGSDVCNELGSDIRATGGSQCMATVSLSSALITLGNELLTRPWGRSCRLRPGWILPSAREHQARPSSVLDGGRVPAKLVKGRYHLYPPFSAGPPDDRPQLTNGNAHSDS